MTLITRLHLVPWLRMSGAVRLLSPIHLHGVDRDSFTGMFCCSDWNDGLALTLWHASCLKMFVEVFEERFVIRRCHVQNWA